MNTPNKIEPSEFLEKIYRDNWIEKKDLTGKVNVEEMEGILTRKKRVMVRLLREEPNIEAELKTTLSEMPLYSLEVKLLELNGYNLRPKQKTD